MKNLRGKILRKLFYLLLGIIRIDKMGSRWKGCSEVGEEEMGSKQTVCLSFCLNSQN